MSLSKKLVSNTFFLLLDWGLLAIISFLFWVVIWKNLPPFQTGIFSTVQNLIVLISGITVTGFFSACAKLIPEYIETKKYGLINSLIRFVLATILPISVIISILIFFFAPALTKFIPNLPIEAVIFVSLGTILLTFEMILGSILLAFQNMKKYFITDVVGTAFKLILGALLVYLGFQYVGPLVGLLFASAIIALLRFNVKWLKKTKMQIDKKFIFREYSLPSLIASIGPLTFSSAPYIIIAFFSGLAITGIFSTALAVTSQLGAIIAFIVNAIFPVVSQLSVYNHTKNKQNTIINLAIKYGLLITLPALLVFVLTPRAIVLLLSQKNYLAASDFFPILSTSFVIMGLSNVFLSSLYAIGKMRTFRNIWILSSLIFLATSIPLTFYFSAFGLCVAFLFSVIISFSVSLFYLRKYLVFKLAWLNIVKIIIASLIFVVFIYVADYFQFSLFLKYLLALVGLLFYFFAFIALKFFDEIDVKVLGILSEQIPIFKNLLLQLSKFIEKFL